MQKARIDRLAHEMQQEVALIIHRELKDPRLGFVTITRMELSKDLRYAKVFFSCLGGDAERARSQDALDCSVGFVHGLLKKRFRIKVIPEIKFRYDESITGSLELSRTLDQLKQLPST